MRIIAVCYITSPKIILESNPLYLMGIEGQILAKLFYEGTDIAEVLSPIPGTFYRKPSPDAAPYVEVGSIVEADTTVCLVEVMKTFNEIKAGVAGKVTKVCAENEAFVNPGDVLFIVEQ